MGRVSTFSLVTLSLVLFSTARVIKAADDDSKPHIVFVMVDDWGWANVGYHRDPPTKEVVTPNFDSLAKQGLELDQHYTFKFCSPTRSAFLTGRLPIHVNDKNNPLYMYNPNDRMSGYAGIPRNMTGIATRMREGGYTAHMVGKWHAGGATPDHIPIGRGFESSFGYLNGVNDYYTQTRLECKGTKIVDLWDTDKPAHGVNGTDYEEALFKTRLLKVINDHDPSTKPLFLYYAPHINHNPLQVPDNYANQFSFIDDHDRQIYHAMTKYLDDVMGEMVQALKAKNMWENTLLVVSSDNGGPIYKNGGANNYPLKGGKVSDWQGGVRVNAFVSGGFLPEKMRGQKTDGYIHIADWFSTFCSLAGVDPTDQQAAKAKLPPVDSLNMWPLISGQNSTSPRVDIPISNLTLISGPYKILTERVPQAGWTGPHYPNTSHPEGIEVYQDCKNGCLYNIMDDPEERKDLAKTETQVLEQMQKKLASYQSTYFNPDRGTQWPGACDDALGKYEGFWGPFLT